MTSPKSPFVRFAAGAAVAPLAGAITSCLVAFLFALTIGTEGERNFDGASRAAMFVVFWSFLICLAYTLIVGGAAFLYALSLRRTPSLIAALLIGLAVGALPFTGLVVFGNRTITEGAWMIPAMAVASSIVTAWAFWRVTFAKKVLSPES